MIIEKDRPTSRSCQRLSLDAIRAELALMNEAAALNFNYLPAMRVTFVAAPSAY